MKSFNDYTDHQIMFAAYKYDFMGLRKYIKLSSSQFGGGKYQELEYNGSKYRFKKMDNNNFYLVGKDGYDCVIINFHDEVAVIASMTADLEQCQGFFPSKHGSNLLELSIKFIKQNKKKFNTKQIQLKDNSEKFCNGEYINLSLFLTLTTGHTWYGKHRFKPLKKSDQDIYVRNYKIMQKLKIKDVKFHKIIKKMNKYSNNKKLINKFEKYVKKYENELFIDVFGTFFRKSKFTKRCSIISSIEAYLQKYTGVVSLKGVTYFMDI